MKNGQAVTEELTNHPAYKLAVQITEQSWRDAGMTTDKLEHERQIADLFDEWVAAGHAPEDFTFPTNPERDPTKGTLPLASASPRR